MYKRKLIFTTIFSIAFLVLCIYTGLMVQVISGENDYIPEKADAIIILGHSVNNGEPGEWLKMRLDKGMEMYNEGYAGLIIVTGRKTTKSDVSAAEAMKEYLIGAGILESAVIIEDRAGSTDENLKYSKEITDTLGYESVIVVTNDFHMFRSVYTAKMYYGEVYGAAAETPVSFRKILNYCKEPLSLVKQFITGMLR